MFRAAAIALVISSAPAAAQAKSDKLEFNIAHSFSVSDAKARMQLLFDYWATRYGVKASWDGMVAFVSGSIMGIAISAELTVEDKQVRGVARDPGLLLRTAARDYISRKLKKYLHPNYEDRG